MNVIFIRNEDTELPQCFFRGPEDPYVARTLWVFLVEQLQPGWIVELHNEATPLARRSGEKVPGRVYAAVMNAPTRKTEAPSPAND